MWSLSFRDRWWIQSRNKFFSRRSEFLESSRRKLVSPLVARRGNTFETNLDDFSSIARVLPCPVTRIRRECFEKQRTEEPESRSLFQNALDKAWPVIRIRGIQSRRFDSIERTSAKIPRGTSITQRPRPHASPRFYLQRLHSGRVFYPPLISGNRVSKITRSQLSVVSRGRVESPLLWAAASRTCENHKKEFENSNHADETGRVPGSRNRERCEGIAVERWMTQTLKFRSLKVPGVECVREIEKLRLSRKIESFEISLEFEIWKTCESSDLFGKSLKVSKVENSRS